MQQYTLAKACDACIRAKKRCDRSAPRCQRCLSRDANCTYQNEPLTSRSDTPINPRSGQVSASRALWNSGYGLSTEQPTLSTLAPSEPGVHFMLDSESFSYMLQSLKSSPISFIERGGSSFIHAQLYNTIEAPQSVLTVYGTVRKLLPRLQSGQHVEPDTLNSTIQSILANEPSTVSFKDALALVQSLITIQILTLFNPTLTAQQRFEAESRQRLLTHWTHRLWSTAPVELPAYLSPCDSYILAESVRRAVLVSHTIQVLYQVLKSGTFVHTLYAAALPLGASTDLWEYCRVAPRCREMIARAELISYRELLDRQRNGQRQNPTMFEKMLLAPYGGMNGMEGEQRRQQASPVA